MTVCLLENLDCGRVFEQRSNDVAVVGGLLLTHHDPVTVANRGIDHGVTRNLEDEQVTVADQFAGEGEVVFDVLLGKAGRKPMTPTKDRLPRLLHAWLGCNPSRCDR